MNIRMANHNTNGANALICMKIPTVLIRYVIKCELV